MKTIQFWNVADECIEVNGAYKVDLPENTVEFYIHAVASDAVKKGAICVSVSDDRGNWEEYDLSDKGRADRICYSESFCECRDCSECEYFRKI